MCILHLVSLGFRLFTVQVKLGGVAQLIFFYPFFPLFDKSFYLILIGTDADSDMLFVFVAGFFTTITLVLPDLFFFFLTNMSQKY